MSEREEKFAAFLDETSQFYGINASSDYQSTAELEKGEQIELRLESLEMLEAELHNQALLPSIETSAQAKKLSLYVAKQAALETSYWRWKARRLGLKSNQIYFSFRLPDYLLELSKDLLDDIENQQANKQKAIHLQKLFRAMPTVNSYSSLTSKLNYLQTFAQIIVKSYNLNSTERYQRGLELVLKVLSTASAISALPENQALNISLPIKKEDFSKLVKAYLDQD